jgi:RNA polymerase sigma-70 factor (ECF subfamily)
VTTELPVATPGVDLDIEGLYAAHFPRVYGFALRMLGDKEAALDVAQDTFTGALARAESFRGESAPLTWLLAITRNLCLRRLGVARARRFEDFEAIMARWAEEPSPVFTESELRLYVGEVKEGCLVGLLQCLPLTQRCVFVLHLLNDLPIADVGRIMGKSENAVRILLSRARSRMRAFLCQNCSLLGGSRCSCANMVEFSLKHDLIATYQPDPGLPQIKAELRQFSDEVELYRSLPEPDAAIARLIKSGRYAIFSTH